MKIVYTTFAIVSILAQIEASQLRFTLSGTLSDSIGDLSAGDNLVMTMDTYSPSTPPNHPIDANWANGTYHGISELEISIADHKFQLSDEDYGFLITNDDAAYSDLFSLSINENFLIGTTEFWGMSFSLEDTTNSVFDSTALPQELDVSDFNYKYEAFYTNGPNYFFSIQEINISAIPEPSYFPAICVAFIVAIQLRKKKVKS